MKKIFTNKLLTLLISSLFMFSACNGDDKTSEDVTSEDVTSEDTNITIDDNFNPVQIAKIEASDTESGDEFGKAVSVSGDYIVVGASGEDTNASNAGSVYLYKKLSDGTVTQIAKFQANNPTPDDTFGQSVSISGDYIVVGARDIDGSYFGNAYVFKRNSDTNVSQIAKIGANDAEFGDAFGRSVSISGDYIVVGAHLEDTNGTSAGSAYVFKRNSDSNISQIAKIQALDIGAGDYFGYGVSIDGDYIAVGAYGKDSSRGNSYIFKRNSDSLNDVTQIAKIAASDRMVDDRFGYSLSISGDYMVVGADYADPSNSGVYGVGTAYVYKRNSDSNVSQIAIIKANDAEADDYFGKSVSISGNYIVVGASGEDTNGTSAGSAYVFKRSSDSNVSQIVKIQALDVATLDYFGNAVAIDGKNISVGAKFKDGITAGEGKAYIFGSQP